jgi:hypothetical protein
MYQLHLQINQQIKLQTFENERILKFCLQIKEPNFLPFFKIWICSLVYKIICDSCGIDRIREVGQWNEKKVAFFLKSCFEKVSESQVIWKSNILPLSKKYSLWIKQKSEG